METQRQRCKHHVHDGGRQGGAAASTAVTCVAAAPAAGSLQFAVMLFPVVVADGHA